MCFQKIKELNELKKIIEDLKKHSKKIVFTNGCFDLIHFGHIYYLKEAKKLGDCLIVAVNSDESVRNIKGNGKPIIPQDERAEVLSGFRMIDYITIFQEEDPVNVILELLPDVLVKGGDWKIDKVLGKDIVEAHGGRVVTISPVENKSTSSLILTVLKKYKAA